ncbi:Dolichyl-phosphate-mannose-protein mannosyltransferase [Filimonas lacunae]|uniref:Dolichyl-phosphate-mannose-protein mannosyltransferase n=1 Tax=Filimonas lacunae TaxID=477680 RepID=A0A173MKD4_9BACT|nr:glycosyltransferase family 39 protein [Filimonas lacunae]BAV07936.1 4-amino-4-deoxy-L-arabinose transferase and related glycosyltransferases of PMT family [Filimonas lacunae]SIT06859.1 Dolichyl-phosphate-mannose-protein mannosyltransferase [Filimonas lacunae]
MNKRTILLLAFVLLKFILQYQLVNPVYELQRDEYLHLDQANHLAWGYLSVPPFTSWISYIIQLLGNTLFWIRFFPALFGILTIVMVWKTITALNGSTFAHILGATGVLLSTLLRLNILYQPNAFDVLSWMTLYYCFIRYQQSEKSKWLYIGAVVFALGFLNKYNILFLVMGLIPAILLTTQRKLLVRKELYLSMLLALVLILPNLLWQYHNHFPVIHHMKELNERQLVHVKTSNFLKAQLLFYAGALYMILAAAWALLRYKPFQPHRSFFWSLISTLAIFICFHAKDYYAIGLYPVYIAFGAVYLADIIPVAQRKYWYPITLLIPLLISIRLFQVAFPNKTPEYIIANPEQFKRFGMLRWEDGKDHTLPLDYADMLGWKELAHKVDSIYATIPGNEETLVLCDNYGQTGAINYYTHKGIKAVSFNADYINWFDLSKQYRNLIRVKDYESAHEEMAETSPYFKTAQVAGQIENKNAREYGATIFLFTGATVNINDKIKQEIAETKSKWR